LTFSTISANGKGTNANEGKRWSTTSTIVVADPGREIAWDVKALGMKVARWSYRSSYNRQSMEATLDAQRSASETPKS
jgi:hypothetical protein